MTTDDVAASCAVTSVPEASVPEASVIAAADADSSDPPIEANPSPANRMAREISTIANARSGGPDDFGCRLTCSSVLLTPPTIVRPGTAPWPPR